MDVGQFNGHELYIGLKLDYGVRLWAISASRAISTVAEQLLVCSCLGVSIVCFSRPACNVT